MATAKVDVGIACSAYQAPEWWSAVMAELLAEQKQGIEIGRIHAGSTALPDVNKSNIAADPRIASAAEKRRDDLTDANRVRVARGFLSGDSDWLWFLDDDTVPPKGALSHLLGLRRSFVGGVYYLAKPPHNPIAYYRDEEGFYSPVYHYTHGELLQVDSIGMGCTLIHRSVFEAIMAAYTVYQRPNGTLVPVPNSAIRGGEYRPGDPDVYVQDGYLHTRLRPRPADDNRPWPFFALEYGRTEDHHFCEMACAVGHPPYLDTLVVCGHIKSREVGREAYKLAARQVRAAQKEARHGRTDG